MQRNCIVPVGTEALLSHRQRPDCLIYHFCGEALISSDVQIEAQILSSIKRHGTELSFFRTEGLVKGECFTQRKSTVYRLKHGYTHADFTFLEHKGHTVADIVMLYTNPIAQGNFWALKDFVLNRLVVTLFNACELAMIIGTGMPNTMPVRKKPNSRRDWRTERARDGTPKLVKLYQHLGFERVPGSNEVFMTKEAFTAASTGRRVRSSFQHRSSSGNANTNLSR